MNKLSFGVNTWLWTSPFTTESVSLFPKIKGMGFDFVEIPVEQPDLIDPYKVKAELDRHGLKATTCAAFGPERDLTHENPQVWKNCLNYIDRCLEYAEIWESEFVAGPMYAATGKARHISSEQRKTEWERAVINLKKACVMAEKRGVKLALEPLNRFETDLVNSVEKMMKLIHEIDHPSAGILMDAFHMNIEERDMESAFKLAGEKVLHVHVSENNRGIPGTGQTDWKGLKKGLQAIDYQGPICIESFTPEIKELAGAVCIWESLADDQDEFARKGLRFLKDWIDDY